MRQHGEPSFARRVAQRRPLQAQPSPGSLSDSAGGGGGSGSGSDSAGDRVAPARARAQASAHKLQSKDGARQRLKFLCKQFIGLQGLHPAAVPDAFLACTPLALPAPALCVWQIEPDQGLWCGRGAAKQVSKTRYAMHLRARAESRLRLHRMRALSSGADRSAVPRRKDELASTGRRDLSWGFV
jgi:hypothetical protein